LGLDHVSSLNRATLSAQRLAGANHHMTREQQRINTIQNTLGKMIDTGSRTEVDDPDVREHLEAAQKSLDAAYLAAS
jgi:hypothetical protein